MAVLTPQELERHRQRAEAEPTYLGTAGTTKARMNQALQATEDWFETNKASLLSAIDTATSPAVLPIGMKRAVIVSWLMHKFTRGV